MNNKKNRIKDFLIDSANFKKNRIPEDEGSPSIEEINDKWKEDNQNSEDLQEDDQT